jgi:hypothetical protein
VQPIFKQLEEQKNIAFDVKQTRILPNSVSADSTKFFRYFWVWIAFPIADILSTLLTGYFLKRNE